MFESNPIVPRNPDGILRVILPARISTPRQDVESMESQHEDAEAWLSRVYTGPTEIRRLSEQVSGWIPDRPSMVEAMQLIESGKWDLLLVNEMREIYRNPAFQWATIHACIDADVRLVAIYDMIDTAVEGWENMAHTAILRTGMTVPETRRRVRRKATHSFNRGGMVLRVRFGYRKLTKDEAKSGKFGTQYLGMVKLCEWTPTIQEMGRRVISGDSTDEVAEWLNSENIPTGPYAKSGRWTGRLVEALLRDPMLSGLRRFRVVLYVAHLKTGKTKRKRNPTPQEKAWPELAHLTEAEQLRVIAALDGRSNGQPSLCGPDNPQWQVPRNDSLWPGQHAVDAACQGGRMHRYGKFLKCMNAVSKGQKTCWNHVHVPFEMIYTKVLPWVLGLLEEQPGLREKIIEAAWKEFEQERCRALSHGGALDRVIKNLKKQSVNLTKAIREGGQLKTLIQELEVVERDLDDAERKKAALLESLGQETSITREDIATNWRDLFTRLARESRKFAHVLRKLLPKFVIHPVQPLDCPLIRPRACLTLSTAAWCQAGESPQEWSTRIDLFDPPVHIRHMDDCVTMRLVYPKWGVRRIATRLGIGYMSVKRALRYAALMESQGMTEPYRELHEAPARASRWTKRQKKPPRKAS